MKFLKSLLTLSNKPVYRCFSGNQISHGYNVIEPCEWDLVKRSIPGHIQKPEYASTGRPTPRQKSVDIKNEKEIESIREACKIARGLLTQVGKKIKVIIVINVN